MTSLAYAESGPVQQAPSPLISFVPLIAIFIIFYFLLIRPQQKKIKMHQKMVDAVKKSDNIITSSGIYGSVASVGDTTLEIKIADNVRIKILKSAVSEVISSPESSPVVSASK